MTDAKLLNDPEYRWYHKEEMSKIMPCPTKRKEFGLLVIDYESLRQEYFKTIKEKIVRELDWDRFKELVDVYLSNPKSGLKIKLQPADMYHFERRDGCKCYMCGTISIKTQFHHVIPHEKTTGDNIKTLCFRCHDLLHLAVSASWGKRKK